MDPIDKAFRFAKRKDFLPDYYKDSADQDIPLPIGFGQSNSQPTTVRRMLDWLDVEPGDTILDVGSGSGWTTALLAYLTGSEGLVFAVDRIDELVRFGEENCAALGIRNAKFSKGDRPVGLKSHAPYDRILVSASSEDIPNILLGQLKVGGKMVIPVMNDILEITKLSPGELDITTHKGFDFVPLQ